eukprot:jgi/Hompol1/4967/HPOL_004083-RA
MSTDFDAAALQSQFEDAVASMSSGVHVAAAERFLQDLRRHPAVLPICRQLLETSPSPLVPFHVAVILQDALPRIYMMEPLQSFLALRQYLLSYVLQRAAILNPPALGKLAVCNALAFKLSYLSDSPETRDQLLMQIVQILAQPDHNQRRAALVILHALLDEFSTTKSTPVALACAEKILSWSSASTNAMSFAGLRRTRSQVDDDDASDTATFPETWKDILLVPSVMDLFFKLALIYFYEQSISDKARKCLIRLAGLRGSIFSSEHEKAAYASHFLDNVVKHLAYLEQCIQTSPPVNLGEQILDVSMIGKQLLSNFKAYVLITIPHLRPFLQEIGKITITSVQKLVDDVEDTWNMDSAEELLAMWSCFVYELESILDSERRQNTSDTATYTAASDVMAFVGSIAFEIVRAYVQSRMKTVGQEADDDDEDIDNQIKDLDVYSEQLLYIGCLGRIDGGRSLALIDHDAAIILNEQIHWLTLIAGHILADNPEGEKPMIPSTLQQLSNNGNGNDPCITLPTCLFNILGTVTVPTGTPQHEITSPLLIETLMCPVMLEMFGKSGGAPQALDFLLDKIQNNFIQIVGLLTGLSANKHTRSALLNSAKFNNVVQFFLDNLARLPTSLHSDLIKTIAYIATHTSDAERVNYFLTLSAAIEKMFVTTVQRPDFGRVFQTPAVQEQVINVMELYNGLALAADESNMVLIFETCARHFDAFVKLLDMYHSSPDVELYILQFFRDLVKYQALDVLQQHHYDILYNTALNLIRVYTKNEIGRKRQRGRANEEEELNADLSILLEMLSGLITSEYEGLARDEVLQRLRKPATSVADVVQVVFYGVNALMPLVTEDMLSYPRLCQEYINLVSLLVEYFPDRLSRLPADLLTNLVNSLVYGLNQPASSLGTLALRAMESMALFSWSEHLQLTNSNNGTPTSATAATPAPTPAPTSTSHAIPMTYQLDLLLHQTLICVLYRPFDSNLINAASDAIFTLIIARKETFPILAQRMIDQQPQSTHARLTESFTRFLRTIEAHETILSIRILRSHVLVGYGGHSCIADIARQVDQDPPKLGDLASLNALRVGFSKFLMEVRGVLLTK